MKKFLSILMIAFIASFIISSCSSESTDDVTAETEVVENYNSAYFAEVVPTNSVMFTLALKINALLATPRNE